MIQFNENPKLGMVTLVWSSRKTSVMPTSTTVMGAKGETDAEIRANTSKILNEAAGWPAFTAGFKNPFTWYAPTAFSLR